MTTRTREETVTHVAGLLALCLPDSAYAKRENKEIVVSACTIIAENVVDFFDDIHIMAELARKEMKRSEFNKKG